MSIESMDIVRCEMNNESMPGKTKVRLCFEIFSVFLPMWKRRHFVWSMHHSPLGFSKGIAMKSTRNVGAWNHAKGMSKLPMSFF